MRKIGLREISYINTIYQGIQCCARCGEIQVSICEPQVTGVRQFVV